MKDSETAKQLFSDLLDQELPNRIVAIAWMDCQDHKQIRKLGSGVPVRYQNRFWIATAGHILKPPGPVCGPVVLYGQDEIRLDTGSSSIVKAVKLKDNPDVGYIELISPDPLTERGKKFVDLPRMASLQIEEEAEYALLGYPGSLLEIDTEEALYKFKHLRYETVPRFRDDTYIDIDYDGPSNLPRPHGVSGGPLWSYTSFKNVKIVSTEHLKLAAIQSCWFPDDVGGPRARTVRINAWIAYVDQCMAEEASSKPAATATATTPSRRVPSRWRGQ